MRFGWNLRTESAKHRLGLRAFDRYGRGGFGYVLQGDIVGNNIAIQVLEDLLACFRLRVQQQVILQTEKIGIAQDAPLGIEEK